jgi:hypothetical protein
MKKMYEKPLPEAKANSDIEICGELMEMEFDEAGNLLGL